MEKRTITIVVQTIIIALVAISLGALIFIETEKLIDFKYTALKQTAIDNCLATAKVQSQDPKTGTVTTPENYWFKLCMKLKGYEK